MKTIEVDGHYRFDPETEEKLKEAGLTLISRWFNIYYDDDKTVAVSAEAGGKYIISWNFCIFGNKPGEDARAELKKIAREKYELTEKIIKILEEE